MVNNSLASSFAGTKLEEDLRDFCRQAAAHTSIMPERALALKYAVSPGTVRKTIGKLVDNGILYRKPRSGTYVAKKGRKICRTVIFADSWGDLEHPYYCQYLRGLLQESAVLNINLEVLDCGDKMRHRERLGKAVARKDVTGIILPWCSPEIKQELRANNPELRIIATASQNTPPGISFAGIDYIATGSQAAYYIIGERAELKDKRPVGIFKKDESIMGFRSGLRYYRHECDILQVDEDQECDAREMAAQIMALKPAGLAFDDDILAAEVLRHLGNLQIPVISLANAGTDLLPPYVARLENDGEALGRLVMRFLHNHAPAAPDTDAALLLRPVLQPARQCNRTTASIEEFCNI